MRRAWAIFIAVLAMTLAAEPFVHRHEAFDVERVFGWNALYGFLACAALVLVAKAIGLALKRRDDYYQDD
jgi:hypothetical protein